MNDWLSRVCVGLMFYVASKAHYMATMEIGNSDAWMLLYHGSAATVDLLLLLLCPRIIDGKLCDHMQATCIASIMVNALAWALYLAYAPPVICDTLIGVICYVQYVRLLLVDRHDADTLRRALVRFAGGSRSKSFA